MFKQTKALFVLILLLFSLPLTAGTMKQSNNLLFKPSSESWSYLVAFYGYIFGMNGDITVQGSTSGVSSAPKDIIDNLNNVDAIFQLHGELQKQRWNFFLDPTYLKLTLPIAAGPLVGSVTPELGLFDFGIFYTLKENFNSNKPYKVQAMIAGRAFKIKNTITPSRMPSIAGQQNFVTPMLGARLLGTLKGPWSYSLRGDIGGFDIDDVKKTWDLIAFLNYSFNQSWHAGMAWRQMGINFQRGSGTSRFAMNTKFWGPIVSIGYRG